MKKKRTRRPTPYARVCTVCGGIFSGRSRKFCGPECREKHLRDYHENYKRKKRTDPYIKKTMEPTNRTCEFCGGIIFKIFDNDGICIFNKVFYCHKESCQQAYRDRGRNTVEEYMELNIKIE